ncbi:heat shock transcription factor [Rhodotorula toruloides NP11]|uniref:Heat shock transcription factor n=1 Tax=Rhodotorula toruloides (strain NP11) TaxID=1130832 RepID=M7XIL3_RHOT1|nr:heat shock transcription factor [Rhodotorula toruloides NP11]EMS23719.1 heat shock transcription factor [Rhodotorula toruloides NP11]
MSAAVSAPPIVSLPCPYTAGGCPLFNTLDLPADSPRCAGSCAPSPAPAAPAAPSPSSAPKSPAAAATPSSTDSLFNALLLSELSSGPVDSLPLPSALLKQDSYPSYLDFGISPGQLEVPPPATYLPQPGTSSSTVQLPPRNGAAGGEKHQLWDIEELVPLDGRKKTRTTPPPPARSTSAAQTIAYAGQADLSVLPPLPQPPQAASPTPSDEETEVVTPFISKLSYLLSHAEYEPWIRWDSTGQYILIAHTKPHLLSILEKFFRHTVSSSFIRQLNIYGFKRASTSSLLCLLLDSTPLPSLPSSSSTSPESETFSASDYSAFHNPSFFRSDPSQGRVCRLGRLKPITKERGPRNRSKKAAAGQGGGRKGKKAVGQGGSDGSESP